MSFAADNEFAEIFVPSTANIKANDAKKAAARLSQRSINFNGSQRTSPYKVMPAEVTIIPMKLQSVTATGMINNCMYCLQ